MPVDPQTISPEPIILPDEEGYRDDSDVPSKDSSLFDSDNTVIQPMVTHTLPDIMRYGHGVTGHPRAESYDISQLTFGASLKNHSEVLKSFASLVTNNPDQNALGMKRLGAFLDMIGVSEGTMQLGKEGGYNIQVGGGAFASFSDHPREIINLGGGLRSDAAGKFQFMSFTWNDLAKQLHLPDFSPASQDAAALQLINQCGALKDVVNGDFEAAIVKCRHIWASFPGAGYGQGEHDMAWLKQIIDRSMKAQGADPSNQSVPLTANGPDLKPLINAGAGFPKTKEPTVDAHATVIQPAKHATAPSLAS